MFRSREFAAVTMDRVALVEYEDQVLCPAEQQLRTFTHVRRARRAGPPGRAALHVAHVDYNAFATARSRSRPTWHTCWTSGDHVQMISSAVSIKPTQRVRLQDTYQRMSWHTNASTMGGWRLYTREIPRALCRHSRYFGSH